MELPFLPWPKDRKRKDQLCTFLQMLGNHSALVPGAGWRVVLKGPSDKKATDLAELPRPRTPEVLLWRQRLLPQGKPPVTNGAALGVTLHAGRPAVEAPRGLFRRARCGVPTQR